MGFYLIGEWGVEDQGCRDTIIVRRTIPSADYNAAGFLTARVARRGEREKQLSNGVEFGRGGNFEKFSQKRRFDLHCLFLYLQIFKTFLFKLLGSRARITGLSQWNNS